ncbi:MAG: hypothetical protein DDT40_00792 [candidate division WS2 bacterium]|nr:hypothetical protein [Candidatus Psychracetigena formicireducens]
MKYEISVKPHLFTINWECGVKINIRNIKDAGERITAEVEILSTIDRNNEKLHLTNINLLMPRDLWILSKSIQRKFPLGEEVWQSILEKSFILAIESWREGTPITDIGRLEDIKEVNYLIYPLIAECQPTLIYGEGGSSKSTLALYTALLIHGGLNGHGHIVKQNNALILDWETNVDEIEQKASRLKYGLDLPYNVYPKYRRCILPIKDDIDRIRREVDTHHIKYVVVDSIAAACGGVMKDPDQAIAMFNSLRTTGCTVLLISHVSKQNPDSPFGSVYFYNYARSVWELRRTQDVDSNTVNVALFHRKCNFDKLHKPMGFTITYDKEFIRVEKGEVEEIDKFKKAIPPSSRLLYLLKQKSFLSTKEVSAELEISVDYARVLLNRMQEKNQISKSEDGSWYLVKDNEH